MTRLAQPLSEVQQRPIAWPSRSAALAWYAGGALVAFSVAWIGSDLLNLNRDLYYLVYFTLVLSFIAVFLVRTRVDWPALLRIRLGWSIALGALVAVAAVRNVLGDASTDHPGGAYFGFEVLWRGVVYGLVDAAILFAFPALVTLLLLRGDVGSVSRRLVFAGLALVLVTTMTAAYHAGYSQFRDEDMREPEIGAVFNSVPTLLTANPAGAFVAHTSVHVTAVVHEYEGDSYLPPAATAEAEQLDGGAGLVAAMGWLLLTGLVWWRGRRWLLGEVPDAQLASADLPVSRLGSSPSGGQFEKPPTE